ncbi:MAG TPA: sialate O-acetylesterase [Lacunisphaera sp.]|jgi:sialate O-acetylesterase
MNLSRLFSLSLATSALAVITPHVCLAEIMLASPFTDHAVLQRDLPIPIWGHGTAGEKITVTFHDQKQQTTVAPDGRWSVNLSPMPADARGADLSIIGQTTIILHDVVVGEVWLASGQSNMEWPLNLAWNGKEEVANANLPLVRHLRIEHSPADSPATAVKTSCWQPATSETAGSFTAVGYFFANALAAKLNVPVGIIHSSWGGTPIESWLAEPVLRTTKAWPRFNAEWQVALKVFPEKQADYPALDAAWRKADEVSRATGKPNTLPWPHPPIGPGTAYAPGGLFNGMIAPLVPYAIRGALWYQGESNVGRAGEYAELFPAMIRDWRKTWGQGDFYLLYVQLPNYADGNASGRQWAELREAQNAALKLPAVGVAITIDVGEPGNLHPTNKQPVGERLAAEAEASVYQLPLEGSGPTFESATRERSAMRVKFTHAKNLFTRQDSVPGFELAGSDRVFHAANAVIEGETVIVSSPDVPAPVAVRYAWTNSPDVSLYNGAQLPAAPFRTDNW